ncbi:MAG: BREX system P-loop protein BrxC [Candidatus Xenobiia bacterium LiM19]
MNKVKDLLSRDLGQKIEEIIKLDQVEEDAVYREITEYVVTDRIKSQYLEILKAIAEAPSDPHEGIGVWISGFFGSGKSSFAKNLGYILSNPKVRGESASELFKKQCDDHRMLNYIDSINLRLPTQVIMFDVSVDRAVKKNTEKVAEIVYSVLLRELGYADDYDIAELEIELEAEGKLDRFIMICEKNYSNLWKTIRKGAQRNSRASAVLHEMDPATYPAADSWARAIGAMQADITVGQVVKRIFDLSARRCKGKSLVLIIDEIGQYVARSAEKIEDLRALVEQIGKEGRNRVKAREIPAPVWVIVTSQEKLEDVVAAIDSKRVELAKLMDRFKYRIDLSPSDIREVATRRVLAKRPEAVKSLTELYRSSEGLLNTACRLERTHLTSTVGEEDFVQFYPYLPHFIELSIDIMSGIRIQPGAPKHLGGSNRTIIKQAYEMLVSDRTSMAAEPVGKLVTIDRIFELVEGNLSMEKQKDISDINRRFAAADGLWTVRTAKALALLEFIRDLPRTEKNCAALLVDEVGAPAPLDKVTEALGLLVDAQFVKQTDEGFKLQTAQEKSWETEKRTFLEPRPAERNAITYEIVGDIFSEPKLKNYKYKDIRIFKVGITVDGAKVGEEGQIPVSVRIADDQDDFRKKIQQAVDESRQPACENSLFWISEFTGETDSLLATLFASRQMIGKYEELRAKNKITPHEMECLSNEKNEERRLKKRLSEKMEAALTAGSGVFRGVTRESAASVKGIYDALKHLLDYAIPSLYPRMEIGACSLKGTEAEDLLKAVNLSGLPQIFYDGEKGLSLIVREGSRYVPNPSADVAVEVIKYLSKEHSYGNKVTGKALEEYFGGFGYGWDRDVLRLVLAVLLRASSIEVTYNGSKYRDHSDPHCRTPFTNVNAFRQAAWSPREAIDLQILTKAAKRYEELTGEDDVEPEEASLSAAYKHLADEEIRSLSDLSATVKAHKLPVTDIINEYRQTLKNIIDSTSDECVAMLAGEGTSFKNSRTVIRAIGKALDDKGIETIRKAHQAVSQLWPSLSSLEADAELHDDYVELQELVKEPLLYEKLEQIERKSAGIVSAYKALYQELHTRRESAVNEAVDEIKGMAEWASVPKDLQDEALSKLTALSCGSITFDDRAQVCQECRTGLESIDSQIAGIPGKKTQVVTRIQEITTPEREVMKIRISSFFPSTLDSEDSIDENIERLREHLHTIIAGGAVVVVE